MTPHEELFELAEGLKRASARATDEDVGKPLSDIEKAAREVGRSFSGSWQGYHSRVYYAEFSSPPAGAHFSQEWGLMSTFGSRGSYGDWNEYTSDDVKAHVRKLAGNPDLEAAHKAADTASEAFDAAKAEIISIIQSELEERDDGFLAGLKEEIEKLESLTVGEVVDRISPKGQIMTRDTVVIGQGPQLPPHMSFIAEAKAIHHSFRICEAAAQIATKAASHLERRARKKRVAERVGTNVFIGHGGSRVWKDLKDFVQDRLKLPWDEFNRVPVAGISNIARLAEMLDAAAIAFIVMTAEDEMADGVLHARMNVVHEAGLFQGRLGFTRAVVLLEDGCEQFSNIEGLGQIRFPKEDIGAAFEEIRRVLEREGLIEPI